MCRKAERSDGPMMYLQTVRRRKFVTAGTEADVTRRAGGQKNKRGTWDSGMKSAGFRWDDLCCAFLLLSQRTFKALFEEHIYKSTWSSQTFGQSRKHLSPPRMKSNPFSPAQTCDLDAAMRDTRLNLRGAKSNRGGRRWNITTPSFKDCFQETFFKILGVPLRSLWKGVQLWWTGKGWGLKGNIKEAWGGLSTFPGTQPALFYN